MRVVRGAPLLLEGRFLTNGARYLAKFLLAASGAPSLRNVTQTTDDSLDMGIRGAPIDLTGVSNSH